MADESTREPAPEVTVPADSAPDGAVIVGVDGQEHDSTVVTWAADEAASLGRPLHLQEVVDLGISLMAGEGYLPMTSLPADTLEGEASTLARAAQVARARQPELAVTASSVPGSVAGVLVEMSRSATAIVVGGGGEPSRPFVGSTALSVAAHAQCPAVVLPDQLTGASGRVVVGVDGSKQSGAAVDYALSYAARHGATLRCVVAWSVEVVDGAVVTEPGTPEWDAVETKHRALVERVLADRRTAFPDVPVEIEIRRGKAATALLEAAQGADLLVVGSRGRGGFTGMLLGSVSKRVLEGSTMPVAVLHKGE